MQRLLPALLLPPAAFDRLARRSAPAAGEFDRCSDCRTPLEPYGR